MLFVSFAMYLCLTKIVIKVSYSIHHMPFLTKFNKKKKVRVCEDLY